MKFDDVGIRRRASFDREPATPQTAKRGTVQSLCKETILRSGNARLQNAPAAEQATALVEIAKIANLRLLDIVEEPVDRPVA